MKHYDSHYDSSFFASLLLYICEYEDVLHFHKTKDTEPKFIGGILHESLPQTISLLVYARGCLGRKGPFLVLCPLSVLENWRQELER